MNEFLRVRQCSHFSSLSARVDPETQWAKWRKIIPHPKRGRENIYIWGSLRIWVELLGGRGSVDPRSCYFCFMWMYLEGVCGLGFSFQPLKIPAPRVILFVGWFILCRFLPWRLPSVSLRRTKRPSWNPPLSLHFYFIYYFFPSFLFYPPPHDEIEC